MLNITGCVSQRAIVSGKFSVSIVSFFFIVFETVIKHSLQVSLTSQVVRISVYDNKCSDNIFSSLLFDKLLLFMVTCRC